MLPIVEDEPQVNVKVSPDEKAFVLTVKSVGVDNPAVIYAHETMALFIG